MSPAVPMVAVRPEQGPPLSVPLSFFLTGPVSLGAAGLFVLLRADDGIGSVWAASNVALAHLGAVGLLLFTMTGALYQMLPVVAGAVVPWVRLAHAVHALLVLGAAALVTGQATGQALAFQLAQGALLAALALFLGPAGWALARTPVKGPTAWGMRVALVSLTTVALLGLRLAATRGGVGFEGNWLTLRWAHAHVGFLCWVGGLIAAVSWQVLPMFFFVASPPRAVAWTVTALVAFSLVGLTSAALLDAPTRVVPWAAAPGAVGVWLVQPGWALAGLRGRRRKRPDATLYYWWLSMAAAPACLGLGVATALLDEPAWALTYGLVVLWAWAGALMHGMLTRIVPFLAWLHLCAPRVGAFRMRSAKELLTDREVTVGFIVHAGSVALGLAAVTGLGAWAWRGFGASLVAVAAGLVWEIVTPVLRARTPLGARDGAGGAPSAPAPGAAAMVSPS